MARPNRTRENRDSRDFGGIEMKLTIKQLAELLAVNNCSLRNWLANYQFSKYRTPNLYCQQFEISKGFLSTLENFLERKRSNRDWLGANKRALQNVDKIYSLIK